jgi:Flp pilus assembly CpaE family ATPase
LVNELGNLDILHAGELASGESRIDLGRLQNVLNYARRQYSIIFVDLPSALNRLSIELMNQSKFIFLVTTPEIPSMHLARTRLRQLTDLQLAPQVRLIVNRVEKKGAIGPDQVAKTVGLPVYASFPNDYIEVQKAFLEGKQISPASALGKQLKPFAESLAKDPVTSAAPKKRRFLEVFALQR